VNGAKYNGTGQCPNCGKKIIFKSNGKAGKIHDKTTVNVIQKVSDSELIIRTYKGSNYRCKKDISEFSICENARAFISKTGANAIEAESYYYSYFRGTLTHWIKGDRPVNRLFQNECSFESDLQGHLYCANLDETLKGTDWQYCQIERFYRMTGKPLDIRPYLIKYNKFPAIEYIIKMGLSDLAKTLIYEYGDTNVINKNGSNLRETLGIEPEELPMLQKINVSMNQLELYQGIKWLGLKVDEKLLLWYRKHKISLAENVLIPIRYISQGKLMRYAEEQLEHPRYNSVDMVSFDYKDYLNMAEKLGYDMKNSIVLFPKNLPDAHDTVSKMYDVNKSGIIKKLISDAYKNLEEKYSFTKDGLTLIPPKSAEEITNEGHILHHCVHSYVEKVTNGICLIFFIRRTENIKEPFYTLEVRNGRVIQVQGKYHCAPTKDVEKFLKIWERKKLGATYSA
jgi:DNA-directed RNA polymerase subunit RPC12/RpoP